MEFHQREYFVSRILVGHAKLKIKDDLVLFVHTPTVEEIIKRSMNRLFFQELW